MPSSVSDWIASHAKLFVLCGLAVSVGVFGLACLYRRRYGPAPSLPPVYVPDPELEARMEREQMLARDVNDVLDPELVRLAGFYEGAAGFAPAGPRALPAPRS